MDSQQPANSEHPRDAALPSKPLAQEDLEEFGIELSCPPEAVSAVLAAAVAVHDIPAENAALARTIASAREYDSEESHDGEERWKGKRKVIAATGLGAVVVVSILGAVVYRVLRACRGNKRDASRSMQTAGGARGSRGGSVRSGGSQGYRGAKSQSRRSAKSATDACASGLDSTASRHAKSSTAVGSAAAGTSRAQKAVRSSAAALPDRLSGAHAAPGRGQGSSDTASGKAPGNGKSTEPEAAVSRTRASSRPQPTPAAAANVSPETLPKPKVRRMPPSLSGNVARGIKKPAESLPGSASLAAVGGATAGASATLPQRGQRPPATAPPPAEERKPSATSSTDGAVVKTAAASKPASELAKPAAASKPASELATPAAESKPASELAKPAAASKPASELAKPAAESKPASAAANGKAAASEVPATQADSEVSKPSNDHAAAEGTSSSSAGKAAEVVKVVEEAKGMLAGMSFNAAAQEFRPRDDGSLSVSPVHFNVNAPEFKPTRSASETHSAKGLEASAGPAARSTSQDAPSGGSAEESPPEQIAATAAATAGAERNTGGAGELPTAQLNGSAEALEAVEYDMGSVQLAGADIAADAQLTADELYAKEHLVEVAEALRSLGQAQTSREDLLKTGMEKLQSDIEYCKAHQVRPFIFAEHASTAADFLFHIGEFSAAEKMLTDAVLGARMSGSHKLHATLINNLGAALVKQSKRREALAVHKAYLDETMSTLPATSHFVVLARHSLVDFLRAHNQHALCASVLEDQCTKLHSLYLHTLAQHKGSSPAADGTSTAPESPSAALQTEADGSDTKGGATDDMADALQALARCHLDYGKHFDVLKDRKNAVDQGRKALAYYQQAHKHRVDVNPVYLSFMASQLKSLAEASKASTGDTDVKLCKEARQVYRELMEAFVASGRQRNIMQLHQTIASLSVEIGDTATAIKEMEVMISVLQTTYKCKATDPQMEKAWEAKEAVHRQCGDSEGAQHCHRQALKCKSTLAKSKNSQKGRAS